jgi:hypothetical protein
VRCCSRFRRPRSRHRRFRYFRRFRTSLLLRSCFRFRDLCPCCCWSRSRSQHRSHCHCLTRRRRSPRHCRLRPARRLRQPPPRQAQHRRWPPGLGLRRQSLRRRQRRRPQHPPPAHGPMLGLALPVRCCQVPPGAEYTSTSAFNRHPARSAQMTIRFRLGQETSRHVYVIIFGAAGRKSRKLGFGGRAIINIPCQVGRRAFPLWGKCWPLPPGLSV